MAANVCKLPPFEAASQFAIISRIACSSSKIALHALSFARLIIEGHQIGKRVDRSFGAYHEFNFDKDSLVFQDGDEIEAGIELPGSMGKSRFTHLGAPR
jgi:hypothetical protein